MLNVRNITYKVGNKTLLSDVSIQCHPGKLNLIIGPNGAGKSTLINVICNQLHPSEGSVSFGEKNLTDYTIVQLARIRAVLSQNIELAFPMKVAEVVMMGRYPHFTGAPERKDKKACDEAMDFFNVHSLATREYMTLSGGEKQRVHFARVAAQIWYPVADSCRYMILDEPLTFLDVYHQFHFMHGLKELLKQQDMVIVGVVHDLNLVAKFADKIILLHETKVLAAGNKQQVLTKENIGTAYQLVPEIYHEGDSLHLVF
jgi:iron complex transport system ATP-binding protein